MRHLNTRSKTSIYIINYKCNILKLEGLKFKYAELNKLKHVNILKLEALCPICRGEKVCLRLVCAACLAARLANGSAGSASRPVSRPAMGSARACGRAAATGPLWPGSVGPGGPDGLAKGREGRGG